jgi:hypothetical protein
VKKTRQEMAQNIRKKEMKMKERKKEKREKEKILRRLFIFQRKVLSLLEIGSSQSKVDVKHISRQTGGGGKRETEKREWEHVRERVRRRRNGVEERERRKS